jgi:glycosyltransferase involved in cell wall biosynthesis
MRYRLLIIIPTLQSGGAERVISLLANYLSQHLFYIFLVVIVKSDNPDFYSINENIKIIRLNKRKVRHSLFSLIKIIYKIRPNIIFSTLPQANLIVGMLAKSILFKVKFIARESIVPSIHFNYEKLSYPWILLYKIAIKNFDLIICQSNDIKEDFINYFKLKQKKLVTINNPVDIENIRIKSVDVLSKYNNLKSDYFLIISRLENQKGIDILIDCLPNLEIDSHFYVIGQGSQRDFLERKLFKSGMTHKLTFLGGVANPYPFLKNAKALVLPSRYEGFPNVVLESLALDVPVIALPCIGGVKEILEMTEGSIICSEISHQALANAINSFKLTPCNYEKDVQKYSLNEIMKKYESALIR